MDASQYKRLVAIQSLSILDTEAEEIFDNAVELASTICGTPISLVSVLDDHRLWFKARVGVELTETPIEHAFCKYAIAQEGLFIVGDAHLDARFRDNPLVTGAPKIRFYAGMPLVTADALALGTLCVIDTQPRELTEVQASSLKLLAKQLSAHIEMRTSLNRLHQSLMESNFNSRELSSNNALFLAFMDNSPMIGYMKDEQRRLIYYNQPFANHYGITRTEWLKKTDFDIYPLDFALRYQPVDDSIFEDGKLVVADQTSPAKDGSTTYWRAYKFPFENEAGDRFIAGMSLDVTLEKRAEQELHHRNALFQAFMDNSPMLGYMKDEQRRLVYYNQPFADHYGITRTEWLQKTDFDVYPLDYALQYKAVDDSIFEGGKLVIAQQTVPAKDGSVTYWRAYKFPFENEAGERLIAGLSLDVTTEKLAELALQQSHAGLDHANGLLKALSVTDSLTGLCNRRGFDERFRAELSLATRYRFDLSVMLFDVDNFKSINDTFGHEAGDHVLQQIAQIISHSGRVSDLACRFGGEEFAFLLPYTSLEHGVLLANRIRQKIQDAVWELRPITVSVGVSTNVHAPADCAAIMRRADLALYAAKSQGKNRVIAYTTELENADQALAASAH